MSPSSAAIVSRDVALSAIRPRPGFNVREDSDLEGKEIDDLGTSIKIDSLLTPLLVQQVGNDAYEIVSGHRRYAALKKKGLRGTVSVRVVACATAADAVFMNLAENTQRKPVHPADLACRLYELETGTYPGIAIDADGSGALPVDREQIAARTGLTIGYVGNLIRAWTKLAEKVRREWRKRDVPLEAIVRWAKLKTEEEQIAALEAWKAESAAAAERKAAGLAREKKVESDGDDESAERGPQKRKAIASHLEKFVARREEEKLSARDLEIADAKIATLRWVLGETKRLTFT